MHFRPVPSKISSMCFALLTLAFWLSVAPTTHAQSQPHIGYAFPAGGKQGATFRVAIGGQFLAGVTNVYFSGIGAQGTVLEYSRPLTQRELNDLREKLRTLQERRQTTMNRVGRRDEAAPSQITTNAVWTPADEKSLAEIRKKLADSPRRQANPAIAETATVEITLAPDTEVGARELRVGTFNGLSNPLVFCIGQLSEFTEKELDRSQTPRSAAGPRAPVAPRINAAEPEITITLPATVNGQIMPGDVDRYRFKGRLGQRLVIAASARELIPYLPDAVPGWFQATLGLYDPRGSELAYADDYMFHPDPVLFCEIPKDGEYVVEIKDSIFRGREDFVYRLTVGELPFVTSVFPLGGPVGTQSTVAVKGWNLPMAAVTMEVKEPGVHPLSVRQREWVSNETPFVADTLPESLEREPNDVGANAQLVTPPLIINGRIDRAGDSDMFRFEGRAGSVIVAEVDARRLNSPLDSVLRLTDAVGRLLAVNDDFEDKGAGLTTHHADSRISITLPSTGSYELQLSDAQHHGGSDFGYRLRLSPPRPDFELRVVPSSLNARAGATIPVTVHALRKDGFSGEIALSLKDAPVGFALSGARVPPHQDQVRLTLTVPPTPEKKPLSLRMEGRAMIDGEEIIRLAVPAEDMMQAFAYRHLVPAKELKVSVAGRGAGRATMRIMSTTPVQIPAGGTARIRFASPGRAGAGPLSLELSEPPEGIEIQSTSPSPQGVELVLHCDAAKVKPGAKGNLIVNAYAGGAGARVATKPQANQRRGPLGTLPAIPFEIVEK